jgi:hypothetical protein
VPASRRHPRRGGASGSAVALTLAVLAIATIVLLTLGPLGGAAVTRARAQAVADAAALAGAAEGEQSAREVAAANGGDLVRWRAAGTDVWVEVTVGDARAEARARRDPAAGTGRRDIPAVTVSGG